MKLSPKTKIVDNVDSPLRTLYDDDIDFFLLNQIHKEARGIYEEYPKEIKAIEETCKIYKEKLDAV